MAGKNNDVLSQMAAQIKDEGGGTGGKTDEGVKGDVPSQMAQLLDLAEESLKDMQNGLAEQKKALGLLKEAEKNKDKGQAPGKSRGGGGIMEKAAGFFDDKDDKGRDM